MPKEEFFFDGLNSERMIIRRTEDVEPVIDDVTEFKNSTRNGFSKSKSKPFSSNIFFERESMWLVKLEANTAATCNAFRSSEPILRTLLLMAFAKSNRRCSDSALLLSIKIGVSLKSIFLVFLNC